MTRTRSTATPRRFTDAPAALDCADPHASTQADPVIESFQQTMQAFLEVQKATMLAYLNGRGRRGASAPATDAGAARAITRTDRNGDAIDHAGSPAFRRNPTIATG